MAVNARKYNPGFLSDDELVALFCVRTGEFASLVEILRECDGNANTHQIVIGPRGSGKTSLLLRVAVEAKRDAELSSRFFPVVFAEESYEVATAGEFWLECLRRLAEQPGSGVDGAGLYRTYEELRGVRDDRLLGERCLGALQDFSDREGRRLLLIVENLNMMFADMPDRDAGWRLRQTLQTERRIVLLASATSRFDEIDDPKRALFGLFRVLMLRPLDADECAELWRNVSRRNRAERTMRALRILTGGSPRLLAIMARFGAELSFRKLTGDLLDLVDDHTEYFKSHLETLAPQERRVYLALADLWRPATAAEVADRSRLDTSKVSAHLKRLTERGAVEAAGGTARRRLYYLSERLYNIYYLMRRSRGPDPLIQALIRFMEAYYSPVELKEFGARIAFEAVELDSGARRLHRAAFNRLVELPAPHRDELLSLAPSMMPDWSASPAPAVGSGAAKNLAQRGSALVDEGRLPEAFAAWDEAVRRFGDSDRQEDIEQVIAALMAKALSLGAADRNDEGLAVWTELVSRFGTRREPAVVDVVAKAMVSRGATLGILGRPDAALEAWTEMLDRFGDSASERLRNEVAMALVGMGTTLRQLGRTEEALAAWNEVVRRFASCREPMVRMAIVTALADKGAALVDLHRPTEAMEVWDQALRRVRPDDQPSVVTRVSQIFVNTGVRLYRTGRVEEALAVWNRIDREFGASDIPGVFLSVATALMHKGAALLESQEHEQAIAICRQVERRFSADDTPEVRETVARSLVNKGTALARLDCLEEAIGAWDKVVEGFGNGDTEAMAEQVAMALNNKGLALDKLVRKEDAAAAWQNLVDRFGSSEVPVLFNAASLALVNKGMTLYELGRAGDAVVVWDQAIERLWEADEPVLVKALSTALVDKATALAELGEMKQALAGWDEIVQRFAGSEATKLRQAASTSLFNKATTLMKMANVDEAVAALDEIVQRFGSDRDTAVLEEVATALFNKGTVLARRDRVDEALLAWDECAWRFAASENQALLDRVATCLVNKAFALAMLDRHEETLAVCDELVDRFGAGSTQEQAGAVARALLGKSATLGAMGRHEQMLAICDQTVKRFGDSDVPAVREVVAGVLVNKSSALIGLDRMAEALIAAAEVVRRYSDSDVPTLRDRVQVALLTKAEMYSVQGKTEEAGEAVERVLGRAGPVSSDNLFRGHFLRANIRFRQGNTAASTADIEAMLELVPSLGSLPREVVGALLAFALQFGAAEIRHLIRSSPAAGTLLPLTTALELELGLEPRVAKEVEEVAEDIRREMAELRGNELSALSPP